LGNQRAKRQASATLSAAQFEKYLKNQEMQATTYNRYG
jgi:hypothetical protein